MTLTDESGVFEQLNDIKSIRGFITASISIFEKHIDLLMQRVFRKSDFAVKSVVDSLLNRSGPLFELNIRLKVLVGLGVISTELFEDINAFSELKVYLNNDANEYSFIDEQIINFIKNLHHATDTSFLTLFDLNELKNNPDSLLVQVKRTRAEKAMRSALMLVIMDIYEALQIESPL